MTNNQKETAFSDARWWDNPLGENQKSIKLPPSSKEDRIASKKKLLSIMVHYGTITQEEADKRLLEFQSQLNQ